MSLDVCRVMCRCLSKHPHSSWRCLGSRESSFWLRQPRGSSGNRARCTDCLGTYIVYPRSDSPPPPSYLSAKPPTSLSFITRQRPRAPLPSLLTPSISKTLIPPSKPALRGEMSDYSVASQRLLQRPRTSHLAAERAGAPSKRARVQGRCNCALLLSLHHSWVAPARHAGAWGILGEEGFFTELPAASKRWGLGKAKQDLAGSFGAPGSTAS